MKQPPPAPTRSVWKAVTQAAAGLVALGLLLAAYSDRAALDRSTCEIVYMWPAYEPVPSYLVQRAAEAADAIRTTAVPPRAIPAALWSMQSENATRQRAVDRYRVFLYRELVSDPRFSPASWLEPEAPAGTRPVLFVHGNAGSYKQARSLASRTSMLVRKDPQYLSGLPDAALTDHVDVFTIDFGGELSALSPHLLADQAHYVNAVLVFLSQRYRTDAIPVVGHSMGAVVARIAPLLGTHPRPSSDTSRLSIIHHLLSLAAPHAAPPVPAVAGMTDLYTSLARAEAALSRDHWLPPVVSVTGGATDRHVRSALAAAPSHHHHDGMWWTVHSTAVAGALTPCDHQSILWCRGLLHAQVRGLLAASPQLAGNASTVLTAYRKEFTVVPATAVETREAEWSDDLSARVTVPAAIPSAVQWRLTGSLDPQFGYTFEAALDSPDATADPACTTVHLDLVRDFSAGGSHDDRRLATVSANGTHHYASLYPEFPPHLVRLTSATVLPTRRYIRATRPSPANATACPHPKPLTLTLRASRSWRVTAASTALHAGLPLVAALTWAIAVAAVASAYTPESWVRARSAVRSLGGPVPFAIMTVALTAMVATGSVPHWVQRLGLRAALPRTPVPALDGWVVPGTLVSASDAVAVHAAAMLAGAIYLLVDVALNDAVLPVARRVARWWPKTHGGGTAADIALIAAALATVSAGIPAAVCPAAMSLGDGDLPLATGVVMLSWLARARSRSLRTAMALSFALLVALPLAPVVQACIAHAGTATQAATRFPTKELAMDVVAAVAVTTPALNPSNVVTRTAVVLAWGAVAAAVVIGAVELRWTVAAAWIAGGIGWAVDRWARE
ncbi:hypothetical protein H9P43_003339 [Blastocladiella emersonii ATCC 22665]|nr:hypothetical protein H9P43_003339 [Blastocladiella emersonii ATCC 22665]